MVLKALKSELALPSHTFATLLVCTPYLDCICVIHDAAGTTSQSMTSATSSPFFAVTQGTEADIEIDRRAKCLLLDDRDR